MPKAIFYKKRLERSFYERYFRNATWYRDVARIEAVAQSEATKAGLGAMDALHLAAAYLSRADEFITTEKPPKAIHRSKIAKVVYLFVCGKQTFGPCLDLAWTSWRGNRGRGHGHTWP